MSHPQAAEIGIDVLQWIQDTRLALHRAAIKPAGCGVSDRRLAVALDVAARVAADLRDQVQRAEEGVRTKRGHQDEPLEGPTLDLSTAYWYGSCLAMLMRIAADLQALVVEMRDAELSPAEKLDEAAMRDLARHVEGR